jgi:hypothetical protein
VTDKELQEFSMRVLGRRYTSDFRVVAIGPGPKATLLLHGDRFEISLEELHTIVDRGLFAEAWDR